MEQTKKQADDFGQFGRGYSQAFRREVEPLLADSGVAIIIYYRPRARIEVHLIWDSQERHFSVRDTSEAQIVEDPVFRTICDRIRYEPREKKSYRFEVTDEISGMLLLFARNQLGRLPEYVEQNLELTILRIENEILRDALSRNNLELDLLQETGASLSMSLELEDVFLAIVEALKRLIPFQALAIFILDKEKGIIEEAFAVGYPGSATPELLENKAGRGLVGWVIENGKPLLVPDVSRDPRYVEALASTRSELVMPLFSGSQVIGAFNLESDKLDAYTLSDLNMVTAFANHAALSLVRARLFDETLEKHRIEDELEIARSIQKTFLPRRSPCYAGFDFDGVNIPSEQVGGDYFDFIPIVDNQLGVAIADVSGKGMPAALIMASFRASLIAEIRNNYAIRTIMHKVNNLICESVERGEFVTAVYGVLDVRNRVFTFANAGHNPPFIVTTSGKVVYLEEGGLTLGVLPNKDYRERALQLQPGEVLAMYTDGITEAENGAGEQFGTDRLEKLVKEHRALGAAEIRQAIIRSVQDFKSAAVELDDLTLVLIKTE